MFFWELFLASMITRPRETVQNITINVNIIPSDDGSYDVESDEEEEIQSVDKGEQNNVIPFAKPRN